MKCLIIAAGKGIRLRRRGESKPLIRLLGIPLIERVIRSALGAGFDEFCVVSGYQGERVRPFLDGLARRLGARITHVINEDWERGNGLSVLKAKDHLDEPFLLLMADHLLDPAVLRESAAHPPGEGEITLVVDRDTSNPLVDLEDVTRVKTGNGKVIEIGKGLAEYTGFDTGVFVCSRAIFDALERSVAEDGDTSLSGGVRRLAAEGRVNAFDIGGRFWLDVDDPGALKKAEKALIARLRDKPNDGPVSRYLNRPLSVRISRHLTRLPVTPNQISVFSFLASVLAAGLFVAGGLRPEIAYALLAAGGVLAQFASVIDGCDGEIARLKFQVSAYGGWFDAVLDRYADAFLLFGLTWHACAVGDGALEFLAGLAALGAGKLGLVTGFMAIVGSYMLSYTADKYDGLMRARIGSRRGFRIGRDVRVFIIFLGALLNQPFSALLVIAVLMNAETVRRVLVCRGNE